MCGVCGYISNKLIPSESLWKMNNTMYHRGPDDGGVWEKQETDFAIGMAQRRLSIFDLSQSGHQPMLSKDGRYVIVYNGEVYNYIKLRKNLENLGYSFSSDCDTEVILYAFAEWGYRCFGMFNGMFAIALYDIETKKLTLARDRIGKKPLYYYVKGKEFAFGSELKPIMEYPHFERKVNKDVISHFLCNKYLVAPLSIFENTYKLEPGTYIEYQVENGRVDKNRYWDIVELYNKNIMEQDHDFGSCLKKMDDILQDAVTSRMAADVPVGTFLSGGIDSTLVTAIARKNMSLPINTYSIGVFDEKRDEAPFAAEIAKYLGTNHHEHYVTEEDIIALIEDLPYYYDEPFSDSSQLPTMLVSQYASQDITVALSGDGGDEVFCGYKMYDWTWIAQHFDWCGSLGYRIPGIKHIEYMFSPEIRAILNNRDRNRKTQLYIDVVIEEADKLLGKRYHNIKYEQEDFLKMDNWQIRRMILDMQTYLPDEILAKTDRASMKYSLEVRCPLLDYRIIEESFKIPHQFKYHRFDKKHILKELTYQYVPRELLDRPKKGFSIPIRKWLRSILSKEILHYAEPESLRKQDIFDAHAVSELIQKQKKSDKVAYSSVLWAFYVFQRWYQKYIEDLW